jgi:hypothetical protein
MCVFPLTKNVFVSLSAFGPHCGLVFGLLPYLGVCLKFLNMAPENAWPKTTIWMKVFEGTRYAVLIAHIGNQVTNDSMTMDANKIWPPRMILRRPGPLSSATPWLARP